MHQRTTAKGPATGAQDQASDLDLAVVWRLENGGNRTCGKQTDGSMPTALDLDGELVASLLAAFESFDTDRSGTISTFELGTATEQAGQEITPGVLKEIVKESDFNKVFAQRIFVPLSLFELVVLVDANAVFGDGCGRQNALVLRQTTIHGRRTQDGVLDFAEFVTLIQTRGRQTTADDVMAAYDTCLELRQGTPQVNDSRDALTKDDMTRFLRAMDQTVTDEEINLIFEQADTDRDGRIDRLEFLRYYDFDQKSLVAA